MFLIVKHLVCSLNTLTFGQEAIKLLVVILWPLSQCLTDGYYKFNINCRAGMKVI